MTPPFIPLAPQTDPFQNAFKLSAQIVLRRLLHFEVLPSTNAYAKTQGAAGEPEGLVVLADTQTAGIGRLGRNWYSPPGGLYFSILLRPTTLTAIETPLITLTAGIAVAKVLHQAYGIKAKLKWPNDVLIDDRKVVGILAEQTLIGEQVDYVVVGIGVNANGSLKDYPSELQATATTLQETLKRAVNPARLFGYLISQFEIWYLRLHDKGFSAISFHWRRLCSHLGHPVTITLPKETITGIAEDIAADGSLILRTPAGRQNIRAGDVTSLSSNTVPTPS